MKRTAATDDDMRTSRTREVRDGWAYALLVPSLWTRLPVDPVGSRAVVRRLLDERFASLPRDAVARLRHEAERELRRTVEQAVDAGAVELWLHTGLVRGLTLAASLTVTVVPGAGAPGLAGLVGAADGGVVSTELVPVPEGQAVRRLKHTAAGTDPGATGGVLRDALPPATVVEWVHPVPDSADLLLLTFATTHAEPVREALVALFDAVGASLTWSRGAGVA